VNTLAGKTTKKAAAKKKTEKKSAKAAKNAAASDHSAYLRSLVGVDTDANAVRAFAAHTSSAECDSAQSLTAAN
jgi:hypothetical protein